MKDIAVNITRVPDNRTLKKMWLSIEDHSEASFFVSWGWIGNWLESLPSNITPKLLQITSNNTVIGIGILIERNYWRHRVFTVVETHLNKTGNDRYDALTIEYNDILWDRSVPEDLKCKALTQLTLDYTKEEFHASGVKQHSYWDSETSSDINCTRMIKECNGVDLDEVRSNSDYIKLLSANTRGKIRKAFKDIKSLGPLQVVVAKTLIEALAMYEALVRLHQQTWISRGKSGAFSNEYVYDFHLKLIKNRFTLNEIQLISVYAGSQLIGVLYNFAFRDQVYNYQSGLDYTEGKWRFKPGFIVHCLAIELLAQRGFKYYDMMAGDSQYKRSLGTRNNNLVWITLQKPRLKFKIENKLKEWKQRYLTSSYRYASKQIC